MKSFHYLLLFVFIVLGFSFSFVAADFSSDLGKCSNKECYKNVRKKYTITKDIACKKDSGTYFLPLKVTWPKKNADTIFFHKKNNKIYYVLEVYDQKVDYGVVYMGVPVNETLFGDESIMQYNFEYNCNSKETINLSDKFSVYDYDIPFSIAEILFDDGKLLVGTRGHDYTVSDKSKNYYYSFLNEISSRRMLGSTGWISMIEKFLYKKYKKYGYSGLNNNLYDELYQGICLGSCGSKSSIDGYLGYIKLDNIKSDGSAKISFVVNEITDGTFGRKVITFGWSDINLISKAIK